jgi:hypothetical protein
MKGKWIWIGMLVLGACGKERPLPGSGSSSAGLKGAAPVAVRGFDGVSSLGRVRLTVFQGALPGGENPPRVGVLQEVVRHSTPKESASGIPVIQEYVETLPGQVPVYYSGGVDPMFFSAYVSPEQASRTRNPVLKSLQREFSRAVSYCARFRFKGTEYLRSRPGCQPPFYCNDLIPVELSCSLTGEGEGQCETGPFRLFLPGIPLVSRSFYQWILSEDGAFDCLDRRVGRTTPVLLSESERVERLEWKMEPGVRLKVRVPNPLPVGDPWLIREVQFLESFLNFSWDK